MNTNIATNQEQSGRLLRCGVSADTADMARYEDDEVPMMPWDWTTGSYGGTFPAWSLSALLGLLPKEMGIAVGAYPGTDQNTCFTLIDPDIEPIVADTAIEATVQMIEQLTANGYKLNEI